jgi:hypothetical protein
MKSLKLLIATGILAASLFSAPAAYIGMAPAPAYAASSVAQQQENIELARISYFVYNKLPYKNGSAHLPAYKSERQKITQLLGRDGLSNWTVVDYFNNISGFYGVAVKNKKSGKVVIAFRGSDNFKHLNDWYHNISHILAAYPGSLQIATADTFTQRVMDNHPKSKIIVTGHSLGGWLAQRVSMNLIKDKKKQSRLSKTVTFNAPGFLTGKQMDAIAKKKVSIASKFGSPAVTGVVWSQEKILKFVRVMGGNKSIISDKELTAIKQGKYNRIVNFVIKGDLCGDLLGTQIGRHAGKNVFLKYTGDNNAKDRHGIVNFIRYDMKG